MTMLYGVLEYERNVEKAVAELRSAERMLLHKYELFLEARGWTRNTDWGRTWSKLKHQDYRRFEIQGAVDAEKKLMAISGEDING